jgi:acyl transferase domain-containing protein
VGTFIGARTSNYSERIDQPLKTSIIGIGQNFIAALASQVFDLRGPSVVVDSACSSSLYSLHLACQSLLAGDCEYALAGGVEILLDERPFMLLSQSKALSPEGLCRVFDAGANGFVPGEGCGVVVLKPLQRALADGDHVYGVIRGSAVNNDGRTMGVTTPNPDAQVDVVERALAAAGLSAREIGYIEAHGTGTMIGDPIEMKALSRVFRKTTAERGFCGIGSVKSNHGHLLSAAGVASFIKVVAALVAQELPPTLHCATPNPRFNFQQSPFYPVTQLRPWPVGEPRNAGISGFGFGGTNCHLIVSDLTPVERAGYAPERAPLAPVSFDRRRFWLEKPRAERRSDVVPAPARRPILQLTEVSSLTTLLEGVAS